LGGKWEEVKKNLLLLLPLASKQNNLFLLLLLPLTSKLKNLLLLLPLATKWGSSFLFKKKAKSDHFGSLFSSIIFNSNLEKTYSHNLLGEEKNE
jgi:hypothetical protein